MPPKKSSGKKGKGKGKKEKKPKISISPLHPALLDPEELLVRFLQRVLLWLQENHARIINLFRKLDSDNDNALSREDFFIGMRMLDAPASRGEIDRLISIIDSNQKGRIDILEFDKIIRHYHRLVLAQKYDSGPDTEDDIDELKKSAVSLNFSPSRVSAKCPNCDIGLAEPPQERNLRFLQLRLTLAPFKDLHHHPSHLSLEVTDTTTIHGLCQLIKVHLEGSVGTIAVFTDSSCSKASYLHPSSCLFHCGAVGGTRTHPAEVEVFYDYKPLVNDCPILMDESHLVDVPKSWRRPSSGKKPSSADLAKRSKKRGTHGSGTLAALERKEQGNVS